MSMHQVPKGVSGSHATSLVITSGVIIGGLSLVKDVATGHPSIRPIISGFLLTGMLLLITMVSPVIGKTLAIVGLIGAMATNGPVVLGKLGGL